MIPDEILRAREIVDKAVPGWHGDIQAFANVERATGLLRGWALRQKYEAEVIENMQPKINTTVLFEQAFYVALEMIETEFKLSDEKRGEE